MSGMRTLKLVADLAQLATIRHFIMVSCRDLGLDEQVTWDLELAVDEACTNVIEHAYEGQAGEIMVSVETLGDAVKVIIHDRGLPFDPQAVPVPDPTAPLEERQPGGLGLFLMRQVMDSVEFKFEGEAGNTLVMIKKFRRG
jgi:anti-sigma regulatory factor (Ser/Thr protein kinase)